VKCCEAVRIAKEVLNAVT